MYFTTTFIALFALASAAFAAPAPAPTTASAGATGAFHCSSPLGIQPHPACCKTVTSTDSFGDVKASQCYINTGTVKTGDGNCATGPTQYAGYKGVCCFNTFRLSGGTFPYPTIVDPASDDCITPTA